MKNCIIIVDVQTGFINSNTYFIPKKIENLLDNVSFDYVICTKFVNDESSLFIKQLKWFKLTNPEEQSLAINIKTKFISFQKSSYSGITDELLNYLKKKDIEEAYICGLDTDSCILATIFELFDNGIKTHLIKDCCFSTGGSKYHKNALQIIARIIGKTNVINSDNLPPLINKSTDREEVAVTI